MRIDKMTACFGKLHDAVLSPGPGLTVIEAPNESGKSTWCAFLRTMLYGLSTRERSATADKNRYAPWDGGAMRGVMELTAEGRSITIRRDTMRASLPMGQFSAVYTGTAEEVSDLTANNCGGALLGVPREVFERSAFIREASISIDQDAELERRMAALLSTGEEESSFSEVYGALKEQLNRRRHNKTGLLPKIEAELSEVDEQIQRGESIRTELQRCRTEKEALQARREQLAELLQRHAMADAAEEQREILALKEEAEAANNAATAQKAELAAAGIPTVESLQKLAARLETLHETERARKAAGEAVREAESRCIIAEHNAMAHPLAPATPEELETQTPDVGKKPTLPVWTLLLALLAGGVGGWFYFNTAALAAACGCGLAAVILLALGLITGRRQKQWEGALAEAVERKNAELAEYTSVYNRMREAERAKAKAEVGYSALVENAEELRRGLITAAKVFSPEVESEAGAAAAIDRAFRLHKQAETAERLAEEKKLRYDVRRQNRRFDEVTEDVPRPTADREALTETYQNVRDALQRSAQEESRAEGALASHGDYTELMARKEHLLKERQRLQDEYDAIALAMETLSQASEELQSRFAPALGKCTAKIFSHLTGGRYDNVLLDRELHVSAVESGSAAARSAALLSRGSADQLYLALRLAICEMVLPAEKQIPLILDDTFAGFDDERTGAALRYLVEESRRRQILLFTCHDRERRLLAGVEGVSFIQL